MLSTIFAGTKVLYQHVGPRRQLVQDAASFRRLDVHGHRLLGAVQPDEVAGLPVHGLVVLPGEVTSAGPLDLDHPGAEVGQLSGRERRGYSVLEGDHRDACEWKHSLPSYIFCRI